MQKSTNNFIILSFLVFTLSALLWYFRTDQWITLWAQQHNTGNLSTIAKIAKLPGDSQYPIFICIALLLISCARPSLKNLKGQMYFSLIAMLITGIAVNIIKIIIAKPRPYVWLNMGDQPISWFVFSQHPRFNSFPSGHATTIASVATAFWFFFPKWRVLWILIAALVGASRILSQAHYLSDVIIGYWLGWLVTYCMYQKFYFPKPNIRTNN
jgi:membrane-associated phospholipid phosphatase